jgi:hypothetical protein
MDFINQKVIDGKTYTAYRQLTESAQQELLIKKEIVKEVKLNKAPVIETFIECDGQIVPCKLKEVWGYPEKLKALFEGKE